METYIVTYKEIYPGANEVSDEDRTKTAFVLAESFQDAQRKTENRFKKEMERVFVVCIQIAENSTIIV